jgi:hypothetical protein
MDWLASGNLRITTLRKEPTMAPNRKQYIERMVSTPLNAVLIGES